MRNGSSMIEVQAYGFDAHVPHLQYPLFNAEDRESRVQWWVLQSCDPGAVVASAGEAAGVGSAREWAKNRSTRVPWSALDTALRKVARTGGDMGAYWRDWERGEWWWHVHRNGSTSYAGERHARCSNEHIFD